MTTRARLAAILFSWLGFASLGCDSSVEVDAVEGSIASPIYGEREVTYLGDRVPVCVPVSDGCLRLSVLIDTLDRIDETTVTGELVDADCAPLAQPGAEITRFHGTAFTGHGVLWVDGDASLSDGSERVLEVEAEQGACQ